ncbi:hypothetical protein GCM10009799_09340 [Nocardiopsis rhodophaea]|uniref:Ribonuclease VapC n=1 Tax=Nocardiopsis rhodophaea TaxID=280238 RepID=A0ABP5DTB1_9ACTN
MITYLLDNSALWYLFRTPGAMTSWEGHIGAGAFYICEATRTEFMYSAKSPSHRDELTDEIDALCHLSTIPKTVWRWVDSAQYKLTQRGQHRAAGLVDLVVCAAAVHHGHTVLHVDNDFVTVAAVLKEVEQRDIRS